MRTHKRGLSLILITLQLLPSPVALAVVNNQSNALSVDANKLKPQELSCEDGATPSVDEFCEKLIEEEAGDTGKWVKKKIDPQWCTDHGSPIDATIQASWLKDAPEGQPKHQDATKCNVPLLDSPTEVGCGEANKRLLQCKYRNSQVESQCMAYKALKGAADIEWVLLVLDLAATASCATACFTGGLATPICEGAAMGAGAAEMVATFAMDQGPVGRMVNGIAAAGGLASASIGAAQGGFGAAKTVSETSDGFQRSADGGFTRSLDKGGGVAEKGGDQAKELQGNLDKANEDQSKKGKDAACVSAVCFAVLSGLRVYNIISQNNAKSDACDKVKKLFSEAAVVDPTGQPDVNYGNYTPQNGTSAGGLGGKGGSTATLGGAANSGMACIGAGGGLAACPATAKTEKSGATDAGVLSRSGLDKAVGPMAAQLDSLRPRVGEGAGSLMGAAMGGGSGSGVLSTLAAEAQQHATDLGAQFAPSSYNGGGGGGGGGRGGGGDNGLGGLASLFGGGAQGPAAPRNMVAQYGKPGSPSDIWHTGTHLNLFEIVSGKMEKVATRVSSK